MLNTKQSIYLVIVLVIIGALFYGISLLNKESSNNYDRGVACTMEAKICLDGSAVGRSGPKCEFSKCPDSDGFLGDSGVNGRVFLGPICPVLREPPDPDCADRPFEVNLLVANKSGKGVIKRFKSDSNGYFSVALPLGEYMIRSELAGNVLPYCASDVVSVQKQKYTEIQVNCDTGIR